MVITTQSCKDYDDDDDDEDNEDDDNYDDDDGDDDAYQRKKCIFVKLSFQRTRSRSRSIGNNHLFLVKSELC